MKKKIGKWREIVSILDYSYQPIVNTYTGKIFGLEALLIYYKEAGFETIESVFDRAYHDKYLIQFEFMLMEKAVAKFSQLETSDHIKLFYNMDNRIIQMSEYQPDKTLNLLHKYNIEQNQLCLEITERHPFASFINIKYIFDDYKKQSFKIAIDDFGTGFSGFEFLYHFEPDFIKIDRFFISNIHSDSKKRLFLSYLVNISHMMGISVIAEGIETENEYYFCKSIGCDLIQGYMIEKPFKNLSLFKSKYEYIVYLNNIDKRKKTIDDILIYRQMEYIEPIPVNIEIIDMFQIFKKNKKNSFFPVVNKDNEPLGIIQEESLKDYTYSPFGKEILMNKSIKKKLREFIVRNSISEINTRIEKILSLFTLDENSEGIIITKDGKYIGFLGAKALLKAIHEKNIELAMNQNPLSKLPGNNSIYQYLSQVLEEINMEHFLIYLDLNCFKSFNDKYGFRQGDRALLIFSEILKKFSKDLYIGHIGGDDFFLGYKSHGYDYEETMKIVMQILDDFSSEAVSLYNDEDRKKGYIVSLNREGFLLKFQLLSACAVILHIPKHPIQISIDEISLIIAELKNLVKKNNDKIISVSILKKATENHKLLDRCNSLQISFSSFVFLL